MAKRDFHGYTFYEDGTIVGLHGKTLKKRNNKGRLEIRLNVGGSRRSFLVARLMYNLFIGFNIKNKDLCVTHKDGDKLNIHIDNLILKHRRDLIQGENHIVTKLTDKQVREIRGKYINRKGVNQYDKKGLSLNELAKKYGVTKGQIQMLVRGYSRNKENYKL